MHINIIIGKKDKGLKVLAGPSENYREIAQTWRKILADKKSSEYSEISLLNNGNIQSKRFAKKSTSPAKSIQKQEPDKKQIELEDKLIKAKANYVNVRLDKKSQQADIVSAENKARLAQSHLDAYRQERFEKKVAKNLSAQEEKQKAMLAKHDNFYKKSKNNKNDTTSTIKNTESLSEKTPAKTSAKNEEKKKQTEFKKKDDDSKIDLGAVDDSLNDDE